MMIRITPGCLLDAETRKFRPIVLEPGRIFFVGTGYDEADEACEHAQRAIMLGSYLGWHSHSIMGGHQ